MNEPHQSINVHFGKMQISRGHTKRRRDRRRTDDGTVDRRLLSSLSLSPSYDDGL